MTTSFRIVPQEWSNLGRLFGCPALRAASKPEVPKLAGVALEAVEVRGSTADEEEEEDPIPRLCGYIRESSNSTTVKTSK